jgi:plasmid stability protein
MAQVVVREIEDETVLVLKKRAKRHGRSLEAEVRLILSEAARHEDAKRVWAAIDRFHARMKKSGRRFADSAKLIREDRDR